MPDTNPPLCWHHLPADTCHWCTTAAPGSLTGAQDAAQPAVEPVERSAAPTAGPDEGKPTPGPQTAAQPNGAADPEWDALLDRARAGGTDASAAVCQAYSLGIQAGVKRCAPTDPEPGPQDIPQEWMLPLLAEANHTEGLDVGEHELLDHHRTDGYRHAIAAAYRLGYAAAHGCEITVSDEGDAVHIGDRR